MRQTSLSPLWNSLRSYRMDWEWDLEFLIAKICDAITRASRDHIEETTKRLSYGQVCKTDKKLQFGEHLRCALDETALKNGAPDWIRTSGLRLRRATLYPAELRVPWSSALLTGRCGGRQSFLHQRRMAAQHYVLFRFPLGNAGC